MNDSTKNQIGSLGQYIDHGDGTVTDAHAGLMWMREREPSKVSFVDATSIRKDFAGYIDWRLPTITELKRISPSDYRKFFAQPVVGYYWSCTKKNTNDNYHSWYEIINSMGLVGAGNPIVGAEYVRLVRFVPRVVVPTSITGSGRGIVKLSVPGNYYLQEVDGYVADSVVTLTAHPAFGSKFKQWHGSVSGLDPICTLTVNDQTTVTAEFERLVYSLDLNVTGSGHGIITRSVEANKYVHDTVLSLTAIPDKGSQFKQWSGHASGSNSVCVVKFDAEKTITAEFVKLFSLIAKTSGNGSGCINRSTDAIAYIEDSDICLTAVPAKDSKFVRWHGDVTGRDAICTVTMNSAKTVSAEFVQLESYSLEVTATGTGTGRVKRSVNSKTYFSGSTVTLTAQAEEGSIFNGWHGEATGMDDVCAVTMNSAMSICAEFERVTISDTGITAELGPVGRVEIKKGQFATNFDLTLRNRAEQQVRVKVPLTSYVSQSGQTSEQSGWATGRVNGSKGVTLSAGTFCEMGLVHFMQPEKGDRLYVNVEQVQPSARLCFTFQCTSAGDWSTFLLVNASLENQKEATDSKGTLAAMASVLKRIESLEGTLAEVLRRLDALQSGFSRTASNDVSNQTAPVQTLSEVLAWVAEHDRITVAELRMRLLPLDLLPSAVINEVNERALDMAGELALEEVGHEIMISKVILNEFLAGY